MSQQTIRRVKWHVSFETAVYTDDPDAARSAVKALWGRMRVPVDAESRQLTAAMTIDKVK